MLVSGALFAVTTAALWLGCLRVAWRWSGGGADRVLAASALFGFAAFAIPLACGLTGLGTSAAALAAPALLVAAVCMASAEPPRGVLADAAAAVRATTPAQRAVLAAAVGMAVALLLDMLVQPPRPADPFHLVEVVRWLHGGHPGSVELAVHEWPAGRYPLTNEVALTWGIGVARAFTPATLWTTALLALVATAVHTGLRRRDVPWWGAAAGAATVLLILMSTASADGAGTDLPSVAWLATACALVSARDPAGRHVGPAALALGLAIGTKTNMAVAGLLLVLPLAWPARRGLRWPAAAGIAAGLAACVPWPLRNLLDHGSPLYPFSGRLGGDPLPPLLSEMQGTFLGGPIDALRGYGSVAPLLLGRTGLLLVGAAVVTVLARRADAGRVGLVAGAAMLAWAAAPLSGVTSLGTVYPAFLRYALPAYVAAAVALALATASGAAARRTGALGLAMVAVLAIPDVPRPLPLLAGGLAGVLLLRAKPPAAPARLLAPALTVAVCLAVALPADRFFTPRDEPEIAGVLAFLREQPRYAAGDDPVVTNWLADHRLSGPRLDHDVRLLPTGASCEEVRRAARGAWLVLHDTRGYEGSPLVRAAPGPECMAGARPAYARHGVAVYGGVETPR